MASTAIFSQKHILSSAFASEPELGNIIEYQSGDPKLSYEPLNFNPFKIQKMFGPNKASFESRVDSFGDLLVGEAKKYVGINRKNNRNEIERFLALFDLPFESGNKPFPFCAAGLSYVACTAYLKALGKKMDDVSLAALKSYLGDIDHHYFYPSPSVIDLMNVAKGKRRFISASDMTSMSKLKPGSLVIFDWKEKNNAAHVGIIKSLNVDKKEIQTIEFNTSSTNQSDGGTVAERKRKLDKTITGFVNLSITTYL